MRSTLNVWWNGRLVGQLIMDEHGDLGFGYDPAWRADAKARPISRSLPLRAAAFDRRETRPFFAGLLPEETARANVAAVLGLSSGNDFALLKALGGDVAGALTLWPQGETPPSYDGNVATVALGDRALVELLHTLPKRPLLAGREGLRLSLAGAQTKVPVVMLDGRVALPVPGQPTTHILKPEIERFPASVENEAFVMQLAAACGLDVAAAEPRLAEDHPYLLVTRYDREQSGGQTLRLHQEDFCQALAIAPERKYAAEGGPSFKTSFALLREAASRPAIDVLKLLDAAIFNLIVGNADAHGKNFSLLYREDGTTGLAPLYDLMCTATYPQVQTRLAMKIAETADFKDIKLRIWEKFAGEIAFGLPYLRRRATELTELIQHHAGPVAQAISSRGFESTIVPQCAQIILRRAKQVAASV